MAKLISNVDNSFYGISIQSIHIADFTTELRHGIRQGQPYSWLDFRDVGGTVRWRIKPTAFSKKGVPSFFRLYHRNTYGRPGFHSQNESAIGTRGSFRELIDYIVGHEEYRPSYP